MNDKKKPGRLTALDYLRGYFILVIIIDHLYRWPSGLALFTGEGSLWFNAADGFVIVSGLMIGYVRGFKNLAAPMRTVTEKLWRRAALLYLWLIIATIAYTGWMWLAPAAAGLPHIPIATGDWATLFMQTTTMQFSHVWISFLYLYTIFLALAPAAIWLLRKRLAWVIAVVSIAGLIIGQAEGIKWLQWQTLFFLPAIAGFYLEAIRSWWSSHARARMLLTRTTYVAAVTLMTLAILTKFILPASPLIDSINSYFKKDHIEFGGVIVPFIVFCGLLLLFIKIEPFLARRLHWLLMPFGTHSLTVYIIHGILILLITYAVPQGQSIVVNTALGIVAILGSLALLKIPWVRRFIPR